MTIRTTPSNRLAILLFLGALQILAYYFVGSMLTPRPFSVALPQPDTLLYCQSAKQIALGQPFVFSPGEAPSTGCTSHLYPFLLAIPYLLGMKGASLLLGGFLLNALLYLAFLYAWHHIFESLLDDDRSKLCASVLLGLFGQSACCAFGQTDTGLIMAVTAGVFAAWLKNRRIIFGILLAIAPWCRPEGMMLVVGFGAVLIIPFLLSAVKSQLAGTSNNDHSSLVTRHSALAHGDFIAVCVAAISVVGVFAFNYLLTGQFQFHSVEFKGYFGNLSFLDAVWMTLVDFIAMVRQLTLGQPAGSSIRATFAIPFLGALFAWIGVFTFDWHSRGPRSAGWLLACLLGLLSVASGGWQGTNFDRYLAWLLPTGFVFASHGIIQVAEWAKERLSWEVVTLFAIVFQCVGAIAAIGWFGKNAQDNQLDYETYDSMAKALASNDGDIGSMGSVGGAYLFHGKAIRHLQGLYSPAFRARETICALEILAHEVQNRFDYWLSFSQKPTFVNWEALPLTDEQVFQGLNRFSLWKTDWTCLTSALRPVSTNAPIVNLALADSVDVGYLRDERRTEFAVNYRLPGLSYLAFAKDGECDGTRIVDVGRPVIGWSEMRVRLKPAQDTVMIARIASKAEKVRANICASAETLSLKKESRLNLFVDGEAVASLQTTIDDGDGRFTEIAFHIPGSAIKGDTSFVQIYGDHLAFGYWFYQ